MRRSLVVLGALSLGWALACSGLTDQLKGAVAKQAARAIAESIGVDEGDVTVKPLDNGRWALDTPIWNANCGFGPDSKRPKGFAFELGSGLMADCKVGAGCDSVLGVPCDVTDKLAVAIAIEASTDNRTGKQVIADRKKELEGKGWKVDVGRDPKQPEATVLTATKGADVKGVAIITTSNGGNTAQILVAPIQR